MSNISQFGDVSSWFYIHTTKGSSAGLCNCFSQFQPNVLTQWLSLRLRNMPFKTLKFCIMAGNWIYCMCKYTKNAINRGRKTAPTTRVRKRNRGGELKKGACEPIMWLRKIRETWGVRNMIYGEEREKNAWLICGPKWDIMCCRFPDWMSWRGRSLCPVFCLSGSYTARSGI